MTTPTALSHLASVLEEKSVRWALIGALAANRYRVSPRLTNDIDLLLADAGESLEELESALTSAGWTVHRADSQGDLLRLKHQTHGIADLLIAGTDYQEEAIQRAVEESIDDVQVKVLTVEDVIIHKLIAGRYQDLADIEAILESQTEIDTTYIADWAEFWEVLDRWESVRGSDG